MSAEVASGTRAVPPPMSEGARLVGIFFEPKKAFTDIAQRPRWIVPTLIAIVFSVIYLYAFNTHIGWEPYLHRLLDNNERMSQLPAEQRQNIFNLYLRFLPLYTYVIAVVFIPLAYVIGGGVALGMVKLLMGVPLRFKQVFAVFAYASLVRVIYSVLSTIVVYVTKNGDSLDPQNAFFSNPAVLIDQTKSPFLYQVASNADIFVIWVLLLIAVGLKAAGGKRLSFGGAFFAVLFPFLVYVLLRGALGVLQS